LDRSARSAEALTAILLEDEAMAAARRDVGDGLPESRPAEASPEACKPERDDG
jgi:hypothetical protein